MTTQKTWETCPISGLRERRSDCVLGRESRKKYDEKAAKVLASGGQITDMFDLAKTEGRKTLERLQEELQGIKAEKDKMRQTFWNRAGIQLQANLAKQNSTFHMTEGIRHQAKVQIFRNLYNEDEVYQALSTKAHGIEKAIESLQKYLDIELPKMRKECKERIAAEKQEIETPAA